MKTLRVLVPLDGSPLAEAALQAVCALEAATVLLVRVISSRGEKARKEREASERELALAAEQLRALAPRLETTSLVREGPAADEILAAANEARVGLIVMTTHGESGFDRFVLGKVAAKVIRTAPVPVLAIPAEAPHAAAAAGPCRLLENILVPYDGSELAWRAVEMLVLMGAAGKGKVTLLGVVETLGGRDAVQEARIPHDLASTYLKLRCDGMQEDLEKAAARARDLGLDAVGMHDLGRPAERIILRAEASGATLIAMTTHGRAGISRWLMGSVTEQVLRATTVPLLVCR